MVAPEKKPSDTQKPIIGWKEWLAFPNLGIPAIKAKIDTGARTSALHTFSIEEYMCEGQQMVQFGIHPLQRRRDIELFCHAPVVDCRRVKDSGGHNEMRYVIQTVISLCNVQWPIQVTLTNRDRMMFRMLLGRTAVEQRFIIDPGKSYLGGRKLAKAYSTSKSKKGKVQ
jgi:hypothetical protein